MKSIPALRFRPVDPLGIFLKQRSDGHHVQSFSQAPSMSYFLRTAAYLSKHVNDLFKVVKDLRFKFCFILMPMTVNFQSRRFMLLTARLNS